MTQRKSEKLDNVLPEGSQSIEENSKTDKMNYIYPMMYDNNAVALSRRPSSHFTTLKLVE